MTRIVLLLSLFPFSSNDGSSSLPFFFGVFVFAVSLLFGLRRATGFGGGVSSKKGSGVGVESVDGGGESDDVSDVATGDDMMSLCLVVDGSALVTER